MCGIFGVINKQRLSSADLVKATKIVDYRGPDDEGYLTWSEEHGAKIWAGNDTVADSRISHQLQLIDPSLNFSVGLGHRRLAIIDLSPAGHQPMILKESGLAISFNGEIYNYLEVREELIKLGHQFKTASDTEVILQAWQQWGSNALSRFNGMFSFLILDTRKKVLYAVRDRFGVKPLYYTDTDGYLAFASEVKQLRILPDYSFNLNDTIAYDYLRHGFIDHSAETFEHKIFQVDPGSFISVDLTNHKLEKTRWYELTADSQKLTTNEVFEKYVDLLKDSVRLRLRSDVPVGTALSGGLDSSAIVCLMDELLKDSGSRNVVTTITSCSTDLKYDESAFADTIIDKVHAKSHKIFPSFEKLKEEFDSLLWHMDYPFGSTSQFSQWCVFEGAKLAGVTVMLDGQGADEQLAGYGGNDIAMYNGLFRNRRFRSLWKEIRGYKKNTGRLPKGFLLGALQKNLPSKFVGVFPDSYKPLKSRKPVWLIADSQSQHLSTEEDLRTHLTWQILKNPLPSLLRYEDRNSMAFSIESRTPFMDYRLIEFTLGLDEQMIYKQGTRKYVLREALKGRVPEKILGRKDKMGFVSAEEKWLKTEGSAWFDKMINTGIKKMPHLIEPTEAKMFFHEMQSGHLEFSFDSWRILCLGNWLNSFK